jgi:hypothetical protein
VAALLFQWFEAAKNTIADKKKRSRAKEKGRSKDLPSIRYFYF